MRIILKQYGLVFLGFVFVVGTAHIFATREVAPNARPNFAWGQTGPTGPTGPTGGTGSVGTFNNHTIFGGSAPTISACGTTPTVATGGNDNATTVNIGTHTTDQYGRTVPVLACTVTFATAYTNVPTVTFGSRYNGMQVTAASISTTVMIVYFSKDASGQKFSYHAF